MGIFSFLNEVKQEAKQIKWSDMRSVSMALILVLGVVAVSSALLFIIDSLSMNTISYLIRIW